MIRLIKVILLLLILQFLIGCAASYYSQGKKNLEKENYDAAIEAFQLALEENPDDTKTLRELGITYYRKIEFDKAIPLLLQAFIQDSTDGRTLFYLGTAYEIKKDIPHAIDIYRRYVDVSPLKDIRSSIEARLMRLIRKQIEEEVKAALAQEKTINAAAIPDSTIAVLYFKNMGQNRDLDPIQKGLADMLITDFSKVKKLKIVERVKMQKLMEEMGLGMTGLVDNKTAPRVGKLLGASEIINGSFLDLTGEILRIDAGLVNTKSVKRIQTEQVQDKLNRFFQMEKDLVFAVIDRMRIKLSQEERDEIEVIPTENLLAFMAYCKALDYEDRGMYKEAINEYKKAIELDPNFKTANQNLSSSEKLSTQEIEIVELEQQYSLLSSEIEISAPAEAPVSPAEEAETSPAEEAPVSTTEEVVVSPTVETTVSPIEEVAVSPTTEAPVSTTEEVTVSPTAEATVSPTEEIAVSPTPGEVTIREPTGSVMDQMIHTSGVLDQGFLPGIDSRKPAQEQSQSSFGNTANFEIRVPLPAN